MAKRKKRRGHRTGSVITTRRLNGLGNIKQPNSVAGALVPPLTAGLLTYGGTIAAEQLITPDGSGGMMDMLHKNAAIVGLTAGVLGSIGLWFLAGKPAGIMAGATTLVVGGGTLVKNYIESGTTAGVGYMYRGRRQMGAVVAETMHGLPARGMGAIVMEPYGQQGYGNSGGGEKVSLGAINPSVFGTPTFDM